MEGSQLACVDDRSTAIVLVVGDEAGWRIGCCYGRGGEEWEFGGEVKFV